MESVLVIDNYDSFVHNLARYLRLLGANTNVVRSDQITIAEIDALRPSAIVISPGPKDPQQAGVSIEAIQHFSRSIPILGVCLGHQAIGEAFGATIIKTAPVHGRSSQIQHTGDGLFEYLPNPLKVGRYHSLVIDPNTLPNELEISATTDDGIIMAIQHRSHPIFGLQFHPESVLSEFGLEMLEHFLRIAGVPRQAVS
jgi:anthranilate synthase/aminodeoxychorismate synthase-like glutamine amidotransferase